jgi:hypothetical protein
MTLVESEFRDANLHAISARAVTPSEATLGICDVVVLSPSLQERCCKIIDSGSIATELNILIGGRKADLSPVTTDFAAANLKRLCDFASTARHSVDLSAADRTDSKTLQDLRHEIVEAAKRLRRPLDVGIDLTCCPIYYCLGLIAFLLNNGLTRRLSLFYAEGEYPEESIGDNCHELFTAGEWEAVAIPGLQNPWVPKRYRMYLVSVGFEGYKTLRLCERREPDKVALLFPDPGVRTDYVSRTLQHNQLLIDRFSIREDNILRANAADAVEAWKVMTTRNSEDFASSTVEYLCCGTKPHSLAIALRALCTKQGVVSDIIADEHLPTSVKASGVYWRYDIFDLSAL